MQFSIYLDEDCQSDAYVHALRARGLDVTTVNEQGTNGSSDESQLAFATSRGWVLATRNVRDFTRLHSAWLRRGRTHAGIIGITRVEMGAGSFAAAIANLSTTYDEGVPSLFIYLPAERDPE